MATAKQHIRCRTIIEVLGKPKEHVEKTIKDYVEEISKDPDLIIIKKEFAEPEEKDQFWTTFVEIELIIKGIPKVIDFCFHYMPSSIEILKPEEFSMNNVVIADMLNDLQARLHNVDMIIKKLKNENTFLKRNMNNVFKNIILVSLSRASLNKEKLSKVTGIEESELEIFLKQLIDEKIIKKGENTYSLIKNAGSKKAD